MNSKQQKIKFNYPNPREWLADERSAAAPPVTWEAHWMVLNSSILSSCRTSCFPESVPPFPGAPFIVVRPHLCVKFGRLKHPVQLRVPVLFVGIGHKHSGKIAGYIHMYDLFGKSMHRPNHLIFFCPTYFSFTTKALEEQMNDIENDFRMVGRPGLGIPQLGRCRSEPSHLRKIHENFRANPRVGAKQQNFNIN